jgi:hypothetical protein
MVVVTFPDKRTQMKALGFLMERFSGTVLKTGEHIVPEAALAALAQENIVFTVKGTITHEEKVAKIRRAVARAAQRRKPRATKVVRSSSK